MSKLFYDFVGGDYTVSNGLFDYPYGQVFVLFAVVIEKFDDCGLDCG